MCMWYCFVNIAFTAVREIFRELEPPGDVRINRLDFISLLSTKLYGKRFVKCVRVRNAHVFKLSKYYATRKSYLKKTVSCIFDRE